MRVARLVFVLLLCLSACSEKPSAPETIGPEKALEDGKSLITPEKALEEGGSLIARWRADIVATYGDKIDEDTFGQEIEYYGVEKLFLGVGPRYLPAAIEAYRAETNEYIAEPLGRITCDQAFFGTRMFVLPCSDPVAQVKDMWEKGINPHYKSEERKNLSVWEMRSNFLSWWDHRREFLDRAPLAELIHNGLGRTPGEFRALDGLPRGYDTLCFYGIYSLPSFLDVISEDNNPYMFHEFLRIVMEARERDDASTFYHSEKRIKYYPWELDARFPTSEVKLRYLCEWWHRTQQEYKGLPELWDALEQRFKAVCDCKPSHVKDPVQEFLSIVEDDAYRNPLFLKEGERVETVLRIDTDIDGDNRNETFLSAPQFIDGRQRHIWHLYVEKNGEYEFLRACAFKADTFYVGPFKDLGIGAIWCDYHGDAYRPSFRVRFWKLENDYFGLKQTDRFPTGEVLEKSAKGRWGDHPAPPAAEEAMRKQLFPGAHRVEVQEIPVTPAMHEFRANSGDTILNY
jgi:hypothetical protein